MLSIRAGEERYNHELYKRTKELIKIHIDQGDEPMLTEEGLLKLQKDECINTLLLISKPVRKKPENVVGYSLFTLDFDMMFEGYGLFLDQLYISKAFRGSGYARNMLEAICKEAKKYSFRYIKLYYQNGLQLDHFYAHFGFKNITIVTPFLHFFEIYGHNEMKRYLDIDIPQLNQNTPQMRRNNTVLSLNRNVNFWKLEGYSQGLDFMVACKLPPHNRNRGKPEGNMIILIKLVSGANTLPGMFTLITLKQVLCQHGITTDTSALEMWKAVSRFQESGSPGNISICAFVEKPSICGWLGKMLTFCNFTGSLELIHKNILKDRVISWALKWHMLMGVNFEISVLPGEQRNPLLTTLTNMQLSDQSIKHGWNIAVLDKLHFDEILQVKPKQMSLN